MGLPYTLLQTVVIPLVAAGVCYLLARRLGKDVGWIAFLGLAYTTAMFAVSVGVQVFSTSRGVAEYYAWGGPGQEKVLTFGFLADNLSIPVVLLMNVVLAASAVYSMPYMEKRLEKLPNTSNSRFGLYYLNFLLVASGLAGIALSTNTIELYLFLELVLVPTFVLISLFGYEQKERVGIIYIIWNQLGAFLFLAGLALAYGATGGSFNIGDLRLAQGSGLAYWVAGLILVGWLVKMGIFGLHMWLPITEAEPPTSFAPTMAVVSGIGAYVLARLLLFGMPATFQAFSLPLMVWAVFTMFYGGAVTLAQTDVKYLFAWSTMSQNAYSVLALASWSALGVAGGVFYFVSHILGKFIMFSIAGILLTQTGLRDMKQMGGLASKMPMTATLFVLGALILSAVPPTSGFQAEWIMFAGVFSAATINPTYMAVSLLGLIATALTVGYTFWPIRKIFFGSIPEQLGTVREAPLRMTIPLLAVACISIIIGIYPDLVTKFLIFFGQSIRFGGGS